MIVLQSRLRTSRITIWTNERTCRHDSSGVGDSEAPGDDRYGVGDVAESTLRTDADPVVLVREVEPAVEVERLDGARLTRVVLQAGLLRWDISVCAFNLEGKNHSETEACTRQTSIALFVHSAAPLKYVPKILFTQATIVCLTNDKAKNALHNETVILNDISGGPISHRQSKQPFENVQ